MIPESQPDELEIVFEPDEVSMFIAESLNDAGFSPEHAWLLATRHLEIDWHQAVELLQTGRWTELDIVRVLI